MRLEAAVLNGTGWTIESVLQAVRAAAAILGQCGIVLERLVLNEVDAPASYRFLDTPYSRRLAHQLGLAKPTLYFVADTAHRPAFDAEAIGRGNSRTRPEMADTVWITAQTRDLPIVIAHELAHVLADSGEHSDAPGNLMRDSTERRNVVLTAQQCDTLVATGRGNRLLEAIGR